MLGPHHSLVPLFCPEVVALMDSFTSFFMKHLVSCIGVKYQLNDFLIISDVLLFFLSRCFLHR